MEGSITKETVLGEVRLRLLAQIYRRKILELNDLMVSYSRPDNAVYAQNNDNLYFDEGFDTVFLLANEVGFDIDKIRVFLKENEIEFEEDSDDVLLEEFVDIGLESDTNFADYVLENENGEVVSLLKEIASSEVEFDKLWSENREFYRTHPLENSDAGLNLTALAREISRFNCMSLPGAFSYDGKTFDLVVLLNRTSFQDEYEIFHHEEFTAYALSDYEPYAEIYGSLHYTQNERGFGNVDYYNAKDSMTQEDADFAHYLIGAAKAGLAVSGHVCELFEDDFGDLSGALVNIKGFQSHEKRNQQIPVALFTLMLKSLYRTLDESVRSMVGFDVTEMDVQTYLTEEIVEQESPLWGGVNYIFGEDQEAYLDKIFKAPHLSDREKLELANIYSDDAKVLRDAFTLIEELCDEDLASKFTLFSRELVNSNEEDMVRLAVYNGML